MKETLRKIFGYTFGGATVLLILFVVISVIAFLSGNLMAVFGFRYQSVRHLIRYFVLVELISIPYDLFCQSIPRALHRTGKVDRRQANFLYIPLDTLCTMFVFWIADQFMDSVSATGLSLWVISFLLALLTTPFKGRSEQEDEPDR